MCRRFGNASRQRGLESTRLQEIIQKVVEGTGVYLSTETKSIEFLSEDVHALEWQK